jgi:hypothetical protein
MLRGFKKKRGRYHTRYLERSNDQPIDEALHVDGNTKALQWNTEEFSLRGSRLSLAVIEAVKHGDFVTTPIPKIEEVSKVYIRKAVEHTD